MSHSPIPITSLNATEPIKDLPNPNRSQIPVEDLKDHVRQLIEELGQQPHNDFHHPNTQQQVELANLLATAEVRPTDVIDKPPVCLAVTDLNQESALGTLGNFSLIVGKAKRRKIFLISAIVATASKGDLVMNKIRGQLPADKSVGLYSDALFRTNLSKRNLNIYA